MNTIPSTKLFRTVLDTIFNSIFKLSILQAITMLSIMAFAYANPAVARESRVSTAVAVLTDRSARVAPFLNSPGKSYVQAYVRFDSDLPDDVMMCIDHEFMDGVVNPYFISGGDWMTFVCVQRNGLVWIGAGTSDSLAGIATTDRSWNVLNLNTIIQPNRWYLIRVEVDFSTRKFSTFSIEGLFLKKSLNISGLFLDYPNHAPFDQRAMTYYVGAVRSQKLIDALGTGASVGKPIVYFDDVQGGTIGSDGTRRQVFSNGFEKQSTVDSQPVTQIPVLLDNYVEGLWYLERDEALFTIKDASFARSGSHVGVADANLSD
jgi:hypothetical protein